MPAKKGQSKPEARQPKAEKKDNVDEAPLQAVILADSYNRRFEVLCTDTPRFLLPLCSTPLLDWTLEALSLSKVKQVFVFCGVHAEQIRQHVASSHFAGTMDIQCLSSQTARSAGDALRELDAMGVLNGENPFVLVNSPLVSNYDLTPMIEAHKKRREVDKNFIMTMGVGRGGRPHPESSIMLVHPPSSRLLHYTPLALAPPQSRFTVPWKLFSDPFPTNIDTYETWGPPSRESSVPGYMDTGVDICEADVPALCTENFDYHDMRRHFVNGVLTSELLGKKIAVHVIGEDEEASSSHVPIGRYVERIRDTRTFGEVSGDVLRRWAFPLVPDLNTPGGIEYELRRGNVYIARDEVKLSRTTALEGPLLIGPRTTLNTHTLVRQSTLGGDCAIGPNTSIISSYVFDEARIGANCYLHQCIIGKDVHIADGVKLGRGVVIGNGVRIGKGAQIPDFARIGSEKWRAEYDDDDSEDEEEENSEALAQREKIIGKDGVGHSWPQEEELPADDSDDEGDDPFEHPANKRLLQLGRTLSKLSDSNVSWSTLSAASDSPTLSAMSNDSSLPDVMGLSLEAQEGKFIQESYDTLDRAWHEGHSVDNALVEYRLLIKGLNADWEISRKQVVNYMLGKVDLTSGVPKILASAIAAWNKWGDFPLQLAPHPSKPGQNEPLKVVLDVQEHCVDNAEIRPYFGIILRAMYEAELVDEAGLIRWRGLKRSRGEGLEEKEDIWQEVWAKGKAYVDVLEDMDSDDDDDDEEDDDDE